MVYACNALKSGVAMIYKRAHRTWPYINMFKNNEYLKYAYSEIDLHKVECKLEKLQKQKEEARSRCNIERYNAIELLQRKYMQKRFAIIKYRLKDAYK